MNKVQILGIGIEEYEIADSKARMVSNVAELKAIDNLENGNIIRTIGYYGANDGGSATYLIRTKEDSDVEDLGLIHFINDSLVAEMIINKELNLKQFGATGNGVTDDTDKIQKAIDCIHNNKLNVNLFINDGTYKVTNTITVYSDVALIVNSEVRFISSVNNGATLKLTRLSDDDKQVVNWIDGTGRLILESTIGRNEETIGVELSRVDGTSIHDVCINNLNIRNFKYSFFYKSLDVWNITFRNCIFFYASYGFLYGTDTQNFGAFQNAGERVSFEKCLFTQNLVDVYLTASTWSQMNFHNCSFDFSNCCFLVPYNEVDGYNSINNKISLNQCHIEGITKNIEDLATYNKPYGILYLDNCGYDLIFSIEDSVMCQSVNKLLFQQENTDDSIANTSVFLRNIYIINGDEEHVDNLFLSKNLRIITENIRFRVRPSSIGGVYGVRMNASPFTLKEIKNTNPFFENLTEGDYSKAANTEIGDFIVNKTTGVSSIQCLANNNKYNTNSKKLVVNYDTSYSDQWDTSCSLISKNFIPCNHNEWIMAQLLASHINNYQTVITLKFYDKNENQITTNYMPQKWFEDSTDVKKSLGILTQVPAGAMYYKIQIDMLGGKASSGIVNNRTLEGVLTYKI